MSGNEETLEKFSAQVMVVILKALVTWVLTDVLRQKRQLEATALGKTVERGTQSEFNLVNQITVPTNVYCSRGGECYQHVMEVQRVEERADGCYQEETFRVCIADSETDNEVENVVMDALEPIKSLHLAQSSVLHEPMRSSVVVALAAAHRLIAREPLREATMRSGRPSIAIAGGNDEVGRTDEST